MPPQRLRPVQPPYDVIVGSDLIYYSFTPETPHSKLLLWTLRRLSGPSTRIFLSLSLHHNPGEVSQMRPARTHTQVQRCAEVCKCQCQCMRCMYGAALAWFKACCRAQHPLASARVLVVWS
jgi:hypothetical protein